jgi:hypothetical protein
MQSTVVERIFCLTAENGAFNERFRDISRARISWELLLIRWSFDYSNPEKMQSGYGNPSQQRGQKALTCAAPLVLPRTFGAPHTFSIHYSALRYLFHPFRG